MDKFMIYLPIRAIPKERVAWSRSNGKAYTKKRTRDFEMTVAQSCKNQMRGKPPLEIPLKVTIVSVFKIPKSWSKKKKEQALNEEIVPDGAGIGDTSNLAKSVEDGMNGIVYVDDKQIIDLRSIKKYGEQDEIFVFIEEFKGYDYP